MLVRPRSLVRVLLPLAVLALGACAEAGGDLVSDPADASVGADPDADTTPVEGSDAGVADAATLPPDATTPPPDAARPPPDAARPPPDAAPPPPDAAPVCPTAPCDLIDQCGCAAGQACDLDVADLPNTACRGVNGAGTTETGTCDEYADCGPGYVCITAGDDASCLPYCREDADCVGPRGQCAIDIADGTTPIEGVTVCSSNCVPTDPGASDCPSGWGCYPVEVRPRSTGTSTVVVTCEPAGTRTHGGSCSANGNADCAAGYACIESLFFAECVRMCDQAAPDCSAAPGTRCVNTSPPLTVGTSNYGICQ